MTTIPDFSLEHELAGDGYDIIVGLDEVGRGSLAGPVMVGAAAFLAADLQHYEATIPEGLNDSKKLTETSRERMFEPLQHWCATYAIGSATNTEIDDWGISHALGIAALRALDQVERTLFGNFAKTLHEDSDSLRNSTQLQQDYLLFDDADDASHNASRETQQPALDLFGETEQTVSQPIRVGAILDGPYDYITKALGTFEAPEVPVPAHVVTQVKGDQRCCSVACAAVLAKVTRDRLMVELAKQYPQYGWEHNKGYGAQAHREAIAKYGPSNLHRISWHLA